MIKPKLAIIAVIIIAGALLYAQSRATSGTDITVSKQEIESLFKLLPPQELQNLVTQPEGKKKFIDSMKEVLVLGAEAERLGLNAKADAQADLALMDKALLARMFREKAIAESPKAAEFSKEQIEAYLQQHPNAFEQFISSNPRFKSQPKEQLGDLKNQFAEMELLVEGARKLSLDKDPGVVLLGRLQKSSYLASKLQQQFRLSINVTDDELKKAYDSQQAKFDETRASHILVMFPEEKNKDPQKPEDPKDPKKDESKPKTKEEAKKKAEELLEKIKAGGDFAELAKANSDDPGSAQQGGDLGFFRKDVGFVPEFKDAVFKLKENEVSDIVETQFGYHIIKVTGHRIAPFDETSKQELREELIEKKLKEKFEGLKAKSSVKIDEDFTFPAPPALLNQPPQQGQANPALPAPAQVQPNAQAPAGGEGEVPAKPATK